MQIKPEKEREEIVVVGGGEAGCLAALMIAKNPHYHVTIVEAQNVLLNGASVIASRLHLGGEYPRGFTTAKHCLYSACVWKMLMPRSIYTPVAPISYLIASETDRLGRARKKNRRPEDDGITVGDFEKHYEAVRKEYRKIWERIKKGYNWEAKEVDKLLFGSYKKDEFYRPMKKQEYQDYDQPPGSIACGFRTQELGLNVPKYLTMIQMELERQQRLGNITILTGHKVTQPPSGEKGDFTVRCQTKKGEEKILHASQVINAAGRNFPEVVPFSGHDAGEKVTTAPEKVDVYKRAMLLITLPDNWKTDPAFVMLGKNGGMISPYNDKCAVCYLPGDETAYLKGTELNHANSRLPEDWDVWAKKQKDAWTLHYFEALKERFPILKGASNPRLIVRDTLNFQKKLTDREHQNSWEPEVGSAVSASAPSMAQELTTKTKQSQKLKQELEEEFEPPVREIKEGLYTLCPTKATYSVWSALQVKKFVEDRTNHPKGTFVTAEKDILWFLLPERPIVTKKTIGDRQKFINPMKDMSLEDMKDPRAKDYIRFFRTHPELLVDMLSESPEMIEEVQQGLENYLKSKESANTGFNAENADSDLPSHKWRDRIWFKKSQTKDIPFP